MSKKMPNYISAQIIAILRISSSTRIALLNSPSFLFLVPYLSKEPSFIQTITTLLFFDEKNLFLPLKHAIVVLVQNENKNTINVIHAIMQRLNNDYELNVSLLQQLIQILIAIIPFTLPEILVKLDKIRPK
ncbi:MAG: hypothetical protein EZS28_023453 [Streblomastix strix]|uniref:Uncharacterized protein n=1 Tax=Streblomastix strix TaxID=222440 RepID=A0A5J4VES3_9EUKA|nr:MAG: hypothetical protein EZS28_023453 [Streblomastix strix]